MGISRGLTNKHMGLIGVIQRDLFIVIDMYGNKWDFTRNIRGIKGTNITGTVIGMITKIPSVNQPWLAGKSTIRFDAFPLK